MADASTVIYRVTKGDLEFGARPLNSLTLRSQAQTPSSQQHLKLKAYKTGPDLFLCLLKPVYDLSKLSHAPCYCKILYHKSGSGKTTTTTISLLEKKKILAPVYLNSCLSFLISISLVTDLFYYKYDTFSLQLFVINLKPSTHHLPRLALLFAGGVIFVYLM